MESCLRGHRSYIQFSHLLCQGKEEKQTPYLVLQGSQLLPCHLCVLEARETQGCHPRPSCHPAQAFLCTLVLGGPSFQGAPSLLLGLLGLVPQEAPGFGGRNPHLQVAQVHLWNPEGQRAPVCLEVPANPSLQVAQEVQVAPAAPGIPWVLSGHLFHHIRGSLCVLEGLVGPGDLVAPDDHSHLVPLSEGRHSQGGREAQVFLSDHRGQEVPDLQVDPSQECHP